MSPLVNVGCFIFFCWWTREINTGIIVCGGQAAAHLHTRKKCCFLFSIYTNFFDFFFWIFFFIFSLQSKNFGMEHHIKFNVSIFLNSCITFFNDDGGLLFIVVVHSIFIFQEKEIVDLFKLIFNDFVFLRFESLANLIWRELFKHLQLSLIKGLERLCFLFELWILFWTKKASSCYYHKSIITNEFVLNWSSFWFDYLISFILSFFLKIKKEGIVISLIREL